MENIKEEIVKDLEKVNNLNKLNDVKVKYLGKSGVITELQSKIRDAEDKKAYGMYVMKLRLILMIFLQRKMMKLITN